MTIAGGLVLIMLGAILRFAITWRANWVDLHTVGNIVMLGGLAGLLTGLGLALARRRDRDRSTVYEQRYYKDPPPPPQ